MQKDSKSKPDQSFGVVYPQNGSLCKYFTENLQLAIGRGGVCVLPSLTHVVVRNTAPFGAYRMALVKSLVSLGASRMGNPDPFLLIFLPRCNDPACVLVLRGQGTPRLRVDRSCRCSSPTRPYRSANSPLRCEVLYTRSSDPPSVLTGGVIQLCTAGWRRDMLRRGNSCLEGHRPAHSPALGLRALPAKSSRCEFHLPP